MLNAETYRFKVCTVNRNGKKLGFPATRMVPDIGELKPDEYYATYEDHPVKTGLPVLSEEEKRRVRLTYDGWPVNESGRKLVSPVKVAESGYSDALAYVMGR